MDWFPAVLVDVFDETPIDRTLVWRIPDNARERFRYVPGQFITLKEPESDPPHPRAYSLSRADQGDGHLHITVRDMGEMGHSLYGAEEGLVLQVAPPRGRFVLDTQGLDRLVLTAAGSGVTPFHAFVEGLAAAPRPTPTILLHSAKRPEELVFRKDFEQFATAHDWFTYVATVTRPEPDDDWDGATGRIDADQLGVLLGRAGSAALYACGPAPFVRSMMAIGEALGLPKERLRKEAWG
jgi:ferredoxin-NADP reductase